MSDRLSENMFNDLRMNMKSSQMQDYKSEQQFIKKLKQNIIGYSPRVQTVIGTLCGVYCDHTATSRPFKPIEEHILYDIKPMIANSHTETSATGNFSTQLMHYSEESILNSFKVNKQTHFALPVGSGATGALERMIKILGFDQIKVDNVEQPVVYITPYEHHSNILPWVQIGCKVIIIDSDQYGNINYQNMQHHLDKHIRNKKQIVSLSAASNVTSQKTDLNQISMMIKRHKYKLQKDIKFYFAVDGAAYCSHARLDLNQQMDELDYLCLSPHKNLGGNESTGVLIGKKSSYNSEQPPSFPGGGTVLAVVGTDIQNIFYDTDPSHRESPGTPNTIGFYRAALSFQLQDFISLQLIGSKEKQNAGYFVDQIRKFNSFLQGKEKLKNRGVEIYGENNFDNRFGVFSFNIYCPSLDNLECFMIDPNNNETFLHPHYGAKLMNDFFGIQVRSGCSCAGPFGVKLLDIPQEMADDLAYEVAIKGKENKKPGWIRLDTNFIFEQYELDYILQSIYIITLNADKMAFSYGQNQRNGQFNIKCGFKPKYEFGINKVMGPKVNTEYSLIQRKNILNEQVNNAKNIFQNPQQYFYNLKIQYMQREFKSVKEFYKDHDADDGFESLDDELDTNFITKQINPNQSNLTQQNNFSQYNLNGHSQESSNQSIKSNQDNRQPDRLAFRKQNNHTQVKPIFKYSDLNKQYIKSEILSQIDTTHKEIYLDTSEFYQVFGMSYSQFSRLSQSEQQHLKLINSLK